MMYSQTLLFILCPMNFFNLMTVLLYLLSDTAALFLQLNQLVAITQRVRIIYVREKFIRDRIGQCDANFLFAM